MPLRAQRKIASKFALMRSEPGGKESLLASGYDINQAC